MEHSVPKAVLHEVLQWSTSPERRQLHLKLSSSPLSRQTLSKPSTFAHTYVIKSGNTQQQMNRQSHRHAGSFTLNPKKPSRQPLPFSGGFTTTSVLRIHDPRSVPIREIKNYLVSAGSVRTNENESVAIETDNEYYSEQQRGGVAPQDFHQKKSRSRCVHCSKNLQGRIGCFVPSWPLEWMCENCSYRLPRCFSCERKAADYACPLTGKTFGSLSVNDATQICGKCACLTPITSPRSISLAKETVLEFYVLKLKLQFTSKMLGNQHLSSALKVGLEKNRGREAGNNPSKRSSCSSSPKKGAPVERKRPHSLGLKEWNRLSSTSTLQRLCQDAMELLPVEAPQPAVLNGDSTSASKYTKFGRCDCSTINNAEGSPVRYIDRILIAQGLPSILFCTHLSHELLHAWFHLSNFEPLSPKVEEGLCNAVSVMFLRYQLSKLVKVESSGSIKQEMLRELILFCMRKMYENKSPVYGDGFREAMACIEKHGLHATLSCVRVSGNLPR